MFNKNRSCIEIPWLLLNIEIAVRLIKTEVVLKCNDKERKDQTTYV